MWYNSKRSARPLSQAAKTSPSHGEGMGSIPVGVTNKKKARICVLFSYCDFFRRNEPFQLPHYLLPFIKIMRNWSGRLAVRSRSPVGVKGTQLCAFFLLVTPFAARSLPVAALFVWHIALLIVGATIGRPHAKHIVLQAGGETPPLRNLVFVGAWATIGRPKGSSPTLTKSVNVGEGAGTRRVVGIRFLATGGY